MKPKAEIDAQDEIQRYYPPAYSSMEVYASDNPPHRLGFDLRPMKIKRAEARKRMK